MNENHQQIGKRRVHVSEKYGVSAIQWYRAARALMDDESKNNPGGLTWTGRYFSLWRYCNPGTRIDPVMVEWGSGLSSSECEELIAEKAMAMEVIA